MENYDIHKNIKNKLDKFIELNKIPHIIFYGESGSGKRYILNYFIKKIYTKEERKNYTMYVNCAHGKGIKFIRNELKFFAKTNLKNKDIFKSIILFNANHLTIDAQSALRRCIEEYSHTTRFFIIINNKDMLLQPILSRFCIIFIPEPIVGNKRKNLFFTNNNIEKVKNKLMEEKNTFLKNNIHNLNVNSLRTFVEKLYNKGFSALDIINYIIYKEEDCKNKYLYLVYFNKIKKEFRNEKILMYYIIYFTFLRKDLTLENILTL
jgi:DNA polymerase III delta prime subunit